MAADNIEQINPAVANLLFPVESAAIDVPIEPKNAAVISQNLRDVNFSFICPPHTMPG